jgi:hypothetical protein
MRIDYFDWDFLNDIIPIINPIIKSKGIPSIEDKSYIYLFNQSLTEPSLFHSLEEISFPSL